MRRCLHSLLVGVLMFTNTIDVVRACGHLRPWCRPAACASRAPAARCCGWDACAGCVPVGCVRVVVIDRSWGCGWDAREPVVVQVGEACESIAWGTPLDTAASAATTPAPVPLADSAVAPAPAGEPTPAPAPVASAVPDLEPVAPASAIEPVVPPASEAAVAEVTMPGDAAVAPEPPAPAEPEAPAEPTSPAPEVPAPATAVEPGDVVAPEPPRTPQPPPRNAFDDAEEGSEPEAVVPEDGAAGAMPRDVDAAPGGDPAGESTGDAADPADEAPALEIEPAEPAAEPEAAAEPIRRWIDDTASFTTLGRLVDVHGDVVEILTAGGRRVQVPLHRLSRFDRDYVVEAGPRVVARRQGPRAFDTASR